MYQYPASFQFRKPGLSCLHVLFFISLVTLILLIPSTNVYSAQVTLAWNPNNESDLAGYKLYYGNSSRNYDTNIDVGNQTSYTISGLVDGNAYYFFAATAYDFSGNESGYSAEVFYNVPVVPSLWPVTGALSGQSSKLWAQVENTSSSALPSDAKVRFWVTGPGWSGTHWVGETSVAGLGVGETKWYLYDWNIPSDAPVGTYKYWAQVWTTSEAISPWSAREDFSATGGKAQVVYLGPVTGALSGQSSSLWVDVENTSSSALPSDARVWFWVSGSGWVGSTSVAGLAAGSTQSYSYNWFIPSDAQAGTYKYWAKVWTTSEAISSWSTREDFSVQ